MVHNEISRTCRGTTSSGCRVEILCGCRVLLPLGLRGGAQPVARTLGCRTRRRHWCCSLRPRLPVAGLPGRSAFGPRGRTARPAGAARVPGRGAPGQPIPRRAPGHAASGWVRFTTRTDTARQLSLGHTMDSRAGLVEPRRPGMYDQEIFLTLKEFAPVFSRGGDMAMDFLAGEESNR